MMVDTGGIEIANTDSIAVSIREQAKIAIKEADVILFVCDARTGVTTEDQDVYKRQPLFPPIENHGLHAWMVKA